jgi:hypothetical protein
MNIVTATLLISCLAISISFGEHCPAEKCGVYYEYFATSNLYCYFCKRIVDFVEDWGVPLPDFRKKIPDNIGIVKKFTVDDSYFTHSINGTGYQ